ncbi:MAG TPA: hypothetical protein VN873_09995 [Candidatus Angelobacter sp.]|nr:hypothetical protein [Candidatus Angelobacter sp.]
MNTFLKSLIDSGPKFLFGALGGIIGFFAGVWKYDRDQKWQRAQVILNLMDAFKADPLIQAACIMLDWDQRSIRLPDGGQIEFENKILLKALNVFYMHASETFPGTASERAKLKSSRTRRSRWKKLLSAIASTGFLIFLTNCMPFAQTNC